MKRKLKDLTKQETIATLDALYTAAGTVKGREKMKVFLRDLLTPSERIMLGRRIIIARMLLSGEGYDEIARRMKVGKGTVARVDRWLSDQLPGYERAIKEMEKEFDRRAWRNARPQLGELGYLKKKYPLHFLLFPIHKQSHRYGKY